jgi:hypothetical protein
VTRRWTHQRHPAANLEWSNPKIGRKLRDLNTDLADGAEQHQGADQRLVIDYPLGRLGDLVSGATKYNFT